MNGSIELFSIAIILVSIILLFVISSKGKKNNFIYQPGPVGFGYDNRPTPLDALEELDHATFAKDFDHAGSLVELDDTTTREHMTFSHPLDTRQMPYFFNFHPFHYEENGGASYPPAMFSRFYNWYPGFDTSGWSTTMRPGMSYKKWPRNRWLRNNDEYYYINNGKEDDRADDYMS